jgi:hypothetical protein
VQAPRLPKENCGAGGPPADAVKDFPLEIGFSKQGWHVPERSEGRGCSGLHFATIANVKTRNGRTYEPRHALSCGQGRATLHDRRNRERTTPLQRTGKHPSQAAVFHTIRIRQHCLLASK